MDLRTFIRRYCNEQEAKDDDHGKRTTHTGSVYNRFGIFGGDSYDVERDLPEGFIEVTNWADSCYRVIWINWDLMTIITYCEGDITIDVYEDSDEMQIGYYTAEKFYVLQAG